MAVGVPGTMKVVSKAFAGGAGRATSPGGAGAPGAPASEGSVADAQPARLPAAAMANRRRPRWCIPTIAPIRTGRALNERLLTPKVSRQASLAPPSLAPIRPLRAPVAPKRTRESLAGTVPQGYEPRQAPLAPRLWFGRAGTRKRGLSMARVRARNTPAAKHPR